MNYDDILSLLPVKPNESSNESEKNQTAKNNTFSYQNNAHLKTGLTELTKTHRPDLNLRTAPFGRNTVIRRRPSGVEVQI